MRELSLEALAIFNTIIKNLDDEGCRKIDNSQAYMPLHVERLFSFKVGTLYSLAHYFKQNGDMCQDPEMTFIKTAFDKVYPSSFHQAIPPIYEESVCQHGRRWLVRVNRQIKHAEFAELWLINIRDQQGLEVADAN